MLDPALAAKEELLLAVRGGELRTALGRARRRVPGWYGELVEWSAHLLVSLGRSPLTCHNYVDGVVSYLLHLAEEEVEFEAAKGQHIEGWQHRLAVKERLGASSRKLSLTAVRRWYAWRQQTGRGPNPAAGIQGPSRDERMPRKYTRAQLRALLAACGDAVVGVRDRAILLLFIATGARRMEVADLSLDHITLRERVGMVRFYGKGAKERVVTFEGQAVTALREWLAVRDDLALIDDRALFVGLRSRTAGRRLQRSGVDGVIRRATRQARLRLEPGVALHALRVTFATALYDEGVDLERIRVLMGHDDINTTRKYVAISDRQLKTRLPARWLDEVTGDGGRQGLPLHAQHALKRRGL